ncbi:keratin, type II cytoskeletal 1 [Pectinophora gossypiella]|uniref:keratin, type II cytoskeletal 1 n=1 Tax=Pectinophora gossypiella TaxID=13191 RepID=UPI00214F3A47|nr:keratin, type II cytoskeletal 1 [Pectinophora gossypiella]
MWRYVALFALVASCLALPAQDTSHSENELDSINDCLRKDSTSCLKYKFFSFVDKMIGQKDSFALTDGVTVVKATDLPSETGAPRSLDPLQRLKRYLETHTLRIEVKGTEVVDAVSSAGRALEDTVSSFVEDDNEVGESRGKKKKAQKILGPLMMALTMKLMALMPLAIGAIALIAGKALLIGKIALVLSAIIGLKKLLSQQKHVTYEVVAHPHSSGHSSGHDYGGTSGYGGDSGGYGGGGGHSSGGGGGGWGRSIEAHSMAYSAQKPL